MLRLSRQAVDTIVHLSDTHTDKVIHLCNPLHYYVLSTEKILLRLATPHWSPQYAVIYFKNIFQHKKTFVIVFLLLVFKHILRIYFKIFSWQFVFVKKFPVAWFCATYTHLWPDVFFHLGSRLGVEDRSLERSLSRSGCEIHCFDPSLKQPHLLQADMWLHRLSVDWRDPNPSFVAQHQHVKTILNEFGHAQVRENKDNQSKLLIYIYIPSIIYNHFYWLVSFSDNFSLYAISYIYNRKYL